MTPGRLIRQTRERSGLSQARLARRVGTGQSAISRLENDEVSPTVDSLSRILSAMGHELTINNEPMRRNYDPLHHREMMRRTPEERLALTASWNKLAGELTAAGAAAKATKAAGAAEAANGH